MQKLKIDLNNILLVFKILSFLFVVHYSSYATDVDSLVVLTKGIDSEVTNTTTSMGCINNGFGIGLLSTPIAISNSFALIEIMGVNNSYSASTFTIVGYSLVQMAVAYFIGENISSEKFVLNGYVGPNYSTPSNVNWYNSIGGNVSIYIGFRAIKHISLGFECNAIFQRMQFENTENSSFDIMVPFTVVFYKQLHNTNQLAFSAGLGQSMCFDETPKFERETSLYFTPKLKFSTEYNLKKNIVRCSIMLSNFESQDKNIQTISIEYGHSFY